MELKENEFDRRARPARLAKMDDNQVTDDIASAIDFLRKHPACSNGTVGVVGVPLGRLSLAGLPDLRSTSQARRRGWILRGRHRQEARSGEEPIVSVDAALRGARPVRVAGSCRTGARDL